MRLDKCKGPLHNLAHGTAGRHSGILSTHGEHWGQAKDSQPLSRTAERTGAQGCKCPMEETQGRESQTEGPCVKPTGKRPFGLTGDS